MLEQKCFVKREERIKKETKGFNYCKKELYEIYLNEYDDLFEKFLIYQEDKILPLISKNVKSFLGNEKMKIYNDEDIKDIESSIKKNYFDEDFEKIKKIKEIYHSLLEEENADIPAEKIEKHCNECVRVMHSCKENIVLPNYSKYGIKCDFLLCLGCKYIFKNHLLHLLCDKCEKEYFSYIKERTSIQTETNYFPATWSAYHCQGFQYTYMRCPKCDFQLYYNSEKELYKCFKCMWNETYRENTWICEICGVQFISPPKEYKIYENKVVENCIKFGLINKIKAIPLSAICCNKDKSDITYKHRNLLNLNKKCTGTLYLSILYNEIVILCGCCLQIINFTDLVWECPLCNKETPCCKADKNNNLLISNLNERIENNYEVPKQIMEKELDKNTNKSETEGFYKTPKKVIKRIIRPVEDNERKIGSTKMRKTKNSKEKMKYLSNKEIKRVNNCIYNSNKKKFEGEQKEESEDSNLIEMEKELNKNKPNGETPKASLKGIKHEKMDLKQKIVNQLDSLNIKPSSTKTAKNINLNLNLNININNDSTKESDKSKSYNDEPDKCEFNPDEYEKLEQIGEGSFGKIYKVKWLKNNKFYGLKILNLKREDDVINIKEKITIMQDFVNTTNSDGVVRIYNSLSKKINDNEFIYYILMELANVDWDEDINNRSKMGLYYREGEIAYILKQLIKTYASLEKNNIAHRDVKPQNVLIFGNKYKICDFGEARKIEGDGIIHQPIKGSELYMSPVLFIALQNRGKNVIHNSYKSDVFSLGMCVCFAADLGFEACYDIREVVDRNVIKKRLTERFKGRYSEIFIDIVTKMLDFYEDKRPNFIELEELFNQFYI